MLPKCFVDASVIFEPLSKKVKGKRDFKKECVHFLTEVNKNYIPLISIAALGELMKALLSIEDKMERTELESRRERAFHSICEFLQRFQIASIYLSTFSLTQELCKMNHLITPFDALHIATAITSNCSLFVTIDKKLLSNNALVESARKRGLKIRGVTNI